MHQENYSLKWHAYSDHLKTMMKEMMMNEDFSDVTLVTEDKKHIKANINILSACSPVFKDILKKEKNTNPILYLRGIQYTEMESIMQFIYLGEATFYEKRLDEFFAIAKSLEIKELCNSNAGTETDGLKDEPSSCDQDTSIQIHQCELCQKAYSDARGLARHKQSVHEGIKYACDQCDQQFTDKSYLTKHFLSKHEGVKYACDQCDYQAPTKGQLTTHIQSRHEGVKYTCDQCDFQATTNNNLNRHIQSRHEGIKYACDQCEYQATRKGHLIRHIQSMHEGIKYSCDQCEYQATNHSHLKRHIKSMH